MLLYDHFSILPYASHLYLSLNVISCSLTIVSGYRKPQELQISDEDQAEKARRFDFMQGLLMSTILDDKL